MNIVDRKYSASIALAMLSAGMSPLLARVFAARGVPAMEEVGGTLSDLIGFDELTGAVKAASLLADFIQAKKRLLIVGDYDADGATASAVGIRALRAFGADVGYLIPNRLEQGYGLGVEIVRMAANLSPRPDVIITVDNGITSYDGVAESIRLGIPVIVTDHHLEADTTPDALVIVNPNQHSCTFPSKALAGCGVMWYVMWALEVELRRRGAMVDGDFTVESLLPIVAVGTVADVVGLDRNNRILVAEGLRRIRDPDLTIRGIEALALVSEKNPRKVSTTDIGFAIAPRINAAGRLESMDAGVECLTTDDRDKARDLAKQLHEINLARRAIESETGDEAALQYVATIDESAYTVVLHDEHWHKGVIGIVAGRLKERLFKPTFVMATGKTGELVGSGRSIPGFHLRHALDHVNKRCPGVLVKFGGHAMAAGATLRAGTFEIFKAAFEEVARELITPATLNQVVETDGSLALDDASLNTEADLRKYVWGQGFPLPSFDDVFKVKSSKLVGKKSEHLQLVLERGGRTFQGIKFRYEGGAVPEWARLIYKLEANTFNNNTRLQLMVEHLLPV